ncbi:hypothetical protein XPA_009025 [Xanthoria parietina]
MWEGSGVTRGMIRKWWIDDVLSALTLIHYTCGHRFSFQYQQTRMIKHRPYCCDSWLNLVTHKLRVPITYKKPPKTRSKKLKRLKQYFSKTIKIFPNLKMATEGWVCDNTSVSTP